MDNRNSTFRRRPSIRPSARRPSARRPSIRRQSDYRRPPVRRLSGYRRPSVRTPSDHRQPSVRRPSDRQLLVRRPSGRPPCRSSASSSSEIYSSTYTSEYYGSDEDEESEQSLRTTIKTKIQMEKDGLGFIIIQNGPYLQLTGLVEKSAAARDGKLQAGDVFLKIGHANVLGYTLRELRQLLQGTPIGTVLQIQVYRDFLALPSRWAFVMDHIPEKNGADAFSDTSEGSWTSSEGTDEYEDYSEETGSEGDHPTVTDHRAVQEDNAVPIRAHHEKTVHYKDVYEEPRGGKATLCAPAAQAFHSVLPSQPQWISKDWHLFERKKHTFTVGSDIGCDIMVHNDYREEMDIDGDSQALSDGWSAEGNRDVSPLYVRGCSLYWTLPKANIPSSSSSSSLSEVFWLTDSAETLE